MQLTAFVALVSQSDSIDFRELAVVSAALQKQVVRDLERYWDIMATVDCFAALEDVPTGYWPIVVKDDIGYNAAEARLTVGQLLRTLGERDRTIVELRFLDGLTQSEIASQVGVSQVQVSRLLRAALERMRRPLLRDRT